METKFGISSQKLPEKRPNLVIKNFCCIVFLAEFNSKLLKIKFTQTKKDYNMLSNMSQPGTFKFNEKETKNYQSFNRSKTRTYTKEKRRNLRNFAINLKFVVDQEISLALAGIQQLF